MLSLPVSVYALSLVVLFAKFFVAISVQARERLGQRTFRYPEDAAHWRGTVGDDTDLCVRAQNLIRNDGESQIWYVALGAAYVWLGAWPAGAPLYMGLYTLSRVAHAYFFLTARQPHRNRAFSIGMLALFALAGHVAYAAITR